MGVGKIQKQLDFFRREPVHETKMWMSKDGKLVVEHRTLHIFPAKYAQKVLENGGSKSTKKENESDSRKAE